MAVLERSAHSLKGAASNLSAKVTAAAALRLENDARNEDAESAKAKSREGGTRRRTGCFPRSPSFARGSRNEDSDRG